jgi:hypothetical protein
MKTLNDRSMAAASLSSAGVRLAMTESYDGGPGRWPSLDVPRRRSRAGVPPIIAGASANPPAASAVEVSGARLVPHEVYACEIFVHLAAIKELLQLVGYPATVERWLHLRETAWEPSFDAQRTATIREGARAWARRWVHGTAHDMVAAAQRFVADEGAQMWLHRWALNVSDPCHWNGYGATSLNLLLFAEPGLRAWLEPLYARFVEGGPPPGSSSSSSSSAEGGSLSPPPLRRDPALRLCFDGFFWCPRMMTEPRRIEMREAPDGARWPADMDPFALEVLAATFRNRERNVHDPARHCYGSLQPGLAFPCTHLELLANLSAHEQRSDYGDAQLVYSADSHTLSPAEKLARLRDFLDSPPDVARVFELCFRDLRPLLDQHATKLRNSTREEIEQLAAELRARRSLENGPRGVGAPRNPTTGSVCCKVSAMRVAASARPMRHIPADNLDEMGVRLSCLMGTARATFPPSCFFSPVTSPMWVGPPVRVPMPPGAVAAVPSNLVHQIARYQTSASTFSLYKKLCLAGSYSADGALLLRQRRLWRYCWGIDRSPWTHKPCGTSARSERVRTAAVAEPAAGAAAGAAAAQRTTLDAASLRERHRLVVADPDIKQRCIHDAWLAEKTRGRILGIRGLSWLFAHAPEVRPFFSLPHQLARALVLRFPEHYPPQATDVCALADRLIAQREDFEAPAEVAHMIRTLWRSFEC